MSIPYMFPVGSYDVMMISYGIDFDPHFLAAASHCRVAPESCRAMPQTSGLFRPTKEATGDGLTSSRHCRHGMFVDQHILRKPNVASSSLGFASRVPTEFENRFFPQKYDMYMSNYVYRCSYSHRCSLLFPIDFPTCWRFPLPKHITQPPYRTRRLPASNISRQQCAPVDAWQIIDLNGGESPLWKIIQSSDENH